jgi:predicted short-subunit dehydrogenase-like oxidoreductase (DUF2520 family)
MTGKPRITIVGPGNLGRAIAHALVQANYRIDEIVFRDTGKSSGAVSLARSVGARACRTRDAALNAGLVWLSVPDRAIASCAEELAKRGDWRGKTVLHSSGALGSGELRALRAKGAAVASLHPFMTFVPGSDPSLEGVPFAVEGDGIATREASRIARNLGGLVFAISQKQKAAYHAWGSFSSPLVIALLVTAERVARVAGVSPSAARRRMLPILQQTLTNYAQRGAAGAFSGPIIRGDAETVRKHLAVLKNAEVARDVYLALARSALQNLPSGNRRHLAKLLFEQ